MTVYLDTSVVLRRVLAQPGAYGRWGAWERSYASELMRLEATRTVDRMRLEGLLDDEEVSTVLASIQRVSCSLHEVPLSPIVVERAAQSFSTTVGTLDALHLATALLVRERFAPDLCMLTHDRQLARAAVSLGFEVLG